MGRPSSFPTRTGDIVMVCFSQAAFRALCGVMGQPELADDPRFRTNDDRNAHEDELRAVIAGWTRPLSAEDVLSMLGGANIPAAPVWDLKQLSESDHVAARGLVIEGRHSRFGVVPLVGQPVKFSDIDAAEAPRTPMLGEDTDSVLADELGLDDAARDSLRARNII